MKKRIGQSLSTGLSTSQSLSTGQSFWAYTCWWDKQYFSMQEKTPVMLTFNYISMLLYTAHTDTKQLKNLLHFAKFIQA